MFTMEYRLAAVERQLRFHRLVIVGLLVALVALVGYGATEGVPDVIRARRFTVVNAAGTILAEVGEHAGAGYIGVYASGLRAVGLFGNPFSVALRENQTGSYLNSDGLRVFDSSGKAILVAGAEHRGSVKGIGTIGMYNSDGIRVLLATVENEAGAIGVGNRSGKDVILAGANSNGDGVLTVHNAEGKRTVSVFGGPTGGGGLVISNKTGEEVVQAVADEYGMGYVGAYDRQGKGRTLTPK